MIPDAAAMEAWIQQQSTAEQTLKALQLQQQQQQQQQQQPPFQWSSGTHAPLSSSFSMTQDNLDDFKEPGTFQRTTGKQLEQHVVGAAASTGQQQAPQSQQDEGKGAPRIRMPQNEYYRHRHLLKRAPWDPNMTETKPPIYRISNAMGLAEYKTYSSSSTELGPLQMANALQEEDQAWISDRAAWSSPLSAAGKAADDLAVPISSVRVAPFKAKSEISYNLVAYPAEDNYAGVVYPLEWINQVRKRGMVRFSLP
jgi:hypothetical protein